MTREVTPDLCPVNQDVALELMVHHLQLAVAYFEATTSDFLRNKAEAIRLVGDNDDRTQVILIPFMDGLNNFYEAMKKDD